MKNGLWVVVIVAAVFCLMGSVLIVAHVLTKARKREAELGISRAKPHTSSVKASVKVKWNLFISMYLLLCFIFAGIILFQSSRGTNRDALDCLAIPVGAVFFLIAAFSLRNRSIRRKRATAPASATFIKCEICNSSEFGNRSYRSIFEFSAEGRRYRVSHGGKPDKEEGSQVELYYAPEDPSVIYIPELERKMDRFFFSVLLAFGILFPFMALLAPLLEG